MCAIACFDISTVSAVFGHVERRQKYQEIWSGNYYILFCPQSKSLTTFTLRALAGNKRYAWKLRYCRERRNTLYGKRFCSLGNRGCDSSLEYRSSQQLANIFQAYLRNASRCDCNTVANSNHNTQFCFIGDWTHRVDSKNLAKISSERCCISKVGVMLFDVFSIFVFNFWFILCVCMWLNRQFCLLSARAEVLQKDIPKAEQAISKLKTSRSKLKGSTNRLVKELKSKKNQ